LPPRDAPPAQVPPTAQLEAAEGDYRELQYRRAEQTLRKLLYGPDKLTVPDDKLRARELLGACLWYLDEKSESSREFERLLALQPGHTLDKFVYPKPLLDFFESVRTTLVEQGIIARVAEPTADKPPPPTVLRITQREQSRAIAFMPFGVAQFEQDRPGWGAFFAASQGAMALANIGTYAAYMAIYNSGDAQTTEALFISTIATGAVWIALTAWGIIDANVAYEPSRIVGTEVVPAEQAMPGRGFEADRALEAPRGSPGLPP
jgi:hypothetical protein